MGYLDYTDAEIRNLTRQRRREAAVARLKAIYGETRVFSSVEIEARRAIRRAVTAEQEAKALAKGIVKKPPRRRPAYAIHPGGPHERYLSRGTFEKLRGFQDGCCYLCRRPFTPDDDATQDHVTPRARGGKDPGNILLAHLECNTLKADRMPTPDELAYLAGIKAKFVAEFVPANPAPSRPSLLALIRRFLGLK